MRRKLRKLMFGTTMSGSLKTNNNMNLIVICIYGPPLLLIIATIFMISRSRNFRTLIPLGLALLSAAFFGLVDAQKDPRYSWQETPIHHTMVPVYLMMSSVPAIIAVCFLGSRIRRS